MWLPRLIAWLAVIAGLVLMAVGALSALTGAWLVGMPALGAALGALVGGALLLVLLRISEQLDAAPR